ncbi:hypothetical protein B0T24DRAFT_714269 [Lasiosphaeria ovina]|uniref:F-box domain-containing protein n=1 Tax=Lasiosphaeria ovina TaxID=92902 RepID=A0AAE0NIE7_9PEZI|nr:hypothetical protein B0T24DRAFT_714269 [Lasiosphaeria ovina]
MSKAIAPCRVREQHPGWGLVFEAPKSFDGRWDDADYDNDAKDTYPRIGDRILGFAVHASCWLLLEEAGFRRNPRVLSRLVEINRSQRRSQLEARTIGFVGHDANGKSKWRSDPLNPAEHGQEAIARLMAEAKRQYTPDLPAAPIPVTSDPFTRVPQDIAAMVASFLPTADIWTACRVSRAFWQCIRSHSFWASRFALGGERAWLLEARKRDENFDQFIRNRKRVIERLALVALSALTPSPQPLGFESLSWATVARQLRHDTIGQIRYFGLNERTAFRMPLPIHIGSYVAGIALSTEAEDENDVYLGYQTTDKRSIQLSELRGFVVAVGYEGVHALKPVTNIKKTLAGESGTDLTLVPRAAIENLDNVHDRGGPSDIQETAWIGDYEGWPIFQTARLAMANPVKELEAEFDGYKMVSLSVPQESVKIEKKNDNAKKRVWEFVDIEDDDETNYQPPGKRLRSSSFSTSSMLNTPSGSEEPGESHNILAKEDLRKCGMWLPSIPGPELNLNDHSFAPLECCITKHSRLWWVKFGGRRGADLSRLIGLFTKQRENLYQVSFSCIGLE